MRCHLRAEQRRRKQEEIGDPPAAPPKYRSAGFLNPVTGACAAPSTSRKECFVSLPQMSRDPTLLAGWTGWDALELCRAAAGYYTKVTEQDGWTAARLTPLLAVVKENLPWIKQWHNEVDPEYNQRLGNFFKTFLHSQLSNLGCTEEDLRTWILLETDHGRRFRRKDKGRR